MRRPLDVRTLSVSPSITLTTRAEVLVAAGVEVGVGVGVGAAVTPFGSGRPRRRVPLARPPVAVAIKPVRVARLRVVVVLRRLLRGEVRAVGGERRGRGRRARRRRPAAPAGGRDGSCGGSLPGRNERQIPSAARASGLIFFFSTPSGGARQVSCPWGSPQRRLRLRTTKARKRRHSVDHGPMELRALRHSFVSLLIHEGRSVMYVARPSGTTRA